MALGVGDVGRTLWTGNKVDRTILGKDGIPRVVQVCGEFLSIRLHGDQSGLIPGTAEAEVHLDFDRCTVRLSNISRTNTGIGDTRHRQGPGVRNLLWSDNVDAEASPIAWNPQWFESRFDQFAGTASPRIRQSRLTMLLVEDAIGLTLTKVTVYGQYAIRALEPLGFTHDCDARSPATRAHRDLRWYEDSCSGGQSKRFGRVGTWARGEFHATAGEGVSLSRDSRHSLHVGLQGHSSGEERSCTATPRAIASLRARFEDDAAGIIFGNEGGVELRCSYETGIR